MQITRKFQVNFKLVLSSVKVSIFNPFSMGSSPLVSTEIPDSMDEKNFPVFTLVYSTCLFLAYLRKNLFRFCA